MKNGLEKILKWCTQELIPGMFIITDGIYHMNRLHQEINRDNTKWKEHSLWIRRQELLDQ